MYALGQVGGQPILGGYTALQSAIVAFESNRLTRAVIQASQSVPVNVITKAFYDTKSKLESTSPSRLSETDMYAVILGTLTQARTDLINAKMFMYSPAASDSAARGKFEQILATDLQMLQQVTSVLNRMVAEGAMPSLVRLVGATSGLGFVEIAIRAVQMAWQTLRVWREAQRRRERMLREQVQVCEELARRGTPCRVEDVARMRAELQQITDTPAARFLESMGRAAEGVAEAAGNVTSPFDNVGQGIGRGLKIGISLVSVGFGLVALWWAWPLISGTRRSRPQRDDEP